MIGFNSIEDLITQRPSHVLDEFLHFAVGVDLVVDVELKVGILEEFVVLSREALLEERHKVGMLHVLAYVVVTLNH